MIMKFEEARKIYDIIVKRIKKSNGKILIFVGFDIDALCALRILVCLLRIDHIKYEIIPIESYCQFDTKLDELKKCYEKNFNERDIKAIFLINCDGTRDMS